MTTRAFKVGDLVRIKEGTHDSQLPEGRTGMIVQRVYAKAHYKVLHDERTNVWKILMTNGRMLRFHQMYLEHVNK